MVIMILKHLHLRHVLVLCLLAVHILLVSGDCVCIQSSRIPCGRDCDIFRLTQEQIKRRGLNHTDSLDIQYITAYQREHVERKRTECKRLIAERKGLLHRKVERLLNINEDLPTLKLKAQEIFEMSDKFKQSATKNRDRERTLSKIKEHANNVLIQAKTELSEVGKKVGTKMAEMGNSIATTSLKVGDAVKKIPSNLEHVVKNHVKNKFGNMVKDVKTNVMRHIKGPIAYVEDIATNWREISTQSIALLDEIRKLQDGFTKMLANKTVSKTIEVTGFSQQIEDNLGNIASETVNQAPKLVTGVKTLWGTVTNWTRQAKTGFMNLGATLTTEVSEMCSEAIDFCSSLDIGIMMDPVGFIEMLDYLDDSIMQKLIDVDFDFDFDFDSNREGLEKICMFLSPISRCSTTFIQIITRGLQLIHNSAGISFACSSSGRLSCEEYVEKLKRFSEQSRRLRDKVQNAKARVSKWRQSCPETWAKAIGDPLKSAAIKAVTNKASKSINSVLPFTKMFTR